MNALIELETSYRQPMRSFFSSKKRFDENNNDISNYSSFSFFILQSFHLVNDSVLSLIAFWWIFSSILDAPFEAPLNLRDIFRS